MRAIGFVLAACLLAGCGEPEKTVEAPRIVADHTAMLMHDSQVKAELVPDHVLGMKTLPGGTLGSYESKKGAWQLFIVDVATAQDAAFLLLDVKKNEFRNDAEYLAHMGGYFGQYASKPVFVFAKTHYLAGVVGLSKDDADPIARTLAARIL